MAAARSPPQSDPTNKKFFRLCPVLDYAQSSGEQRESRHFHWLMGDQLH